MTPHHTCRLQEWDDFYDAVVQYKGFPSPAFSCFASVVRAHIQEYTIPRYGDLPNDLVSKWSQETCIDSIDKYIVRKSIPERPATEHNKDCIKRAHYACIAYFKGGDADKQDIINMVIAACKDYYE